MRTYPPAITCPHCSEGVRRHCPWIDREGVEHPGAGDQCSWFTCPRCLTRMQIVRRPGRGFKILRQRPWM